MTTNYYGQLTSTSEVKNKQWEVCEVIEKKGIKTKKGQQQVNIYTSNTILDWFVDKKDIYIYSR